MNDLISRKEAEKAIKDYFKMIIDNTDDDIDCVLDYNKNLCDVIRETPTAYDVDKVVSELKSHNNTEKMATAKLYNGEHRYYRAVSVTKAIKIVKGGGVDE